MDGRHRYIATVANDAFELGNPNTVEAVMSEHVELFEDFFKADGKKVVFIAYQPRLEEGVEGQLVRQPPPRAWPGPPLRPPVYAATHSPHSFRSPTAPPLSATSAFLRCSQLDGNAGPDGRQRGLDP